MAGCKEACFVFQRLSCTVKQFLQSHCSVCLKWALFCHNIFFQCRLFVSLVNLCETSCFKHLFKGVGWLDRFCECAQISHLSNPCISARLCESPGYAQYYNSFLKPHMKCIFKTQQLLEYNCRAASESFIFPFRTSHTRIRHFWCMASVTSETSFTALTKETAIFLLSRYILCSFFHLLLPAKPPEQRVMQPV